MLAKLEFLLYGPSVAACDVTNWVAAPDAADPALLRTHAAPAPPRPEQSSIISLLGASPHLAHDESEVEDAPDLAPVASRATAVGVVCAPHSLHAGVAGRYRQSLRAPASVRAASSSSSIVCTVTRTLSGCAAPASCAAYMLTVRAVSVIGVHGGANVHHGRDIHASPPSG
jgi:hypothetical protein